MSEFIIKRIWRIWVPCVIAVTLAFGAAKMIGPSVITGVSPWFNSIWQESNWNSYVDHLLMLGKMDQYNQAFIPVVWSLKWEMWGSLLLPLIILIARQSVMIVVAGSALSVGWYWQTGGGFDVHEGLLRFLPMFTLGAMMAYHRAKIIHLIQIQANSTQILLFFLAILLIPCQWYGFTGLPSYTRAAINDYGALCGIALLIAVVLGCANVRQWFEHPLLLWLGKVSFSLYLYHSLVLTIVIRVGASHLPLPFLILISFGLTFALAHLAYQRIESPAMQYGRRMQSHYAAHGPLKTMPEKAA